MVVTSCVASRPAAFTEGFYVRPQIAPLTGSVEPVVVYLFTDKREAPHPRAIGFIAMHGRPQVVLATEAIATGVTRAFVEGFKMRNIPVINRTNMPFKPGESLSDARTGISGTILEFQDVLVRRGLLNYKREAACRILVQAYDVSSGRVLWEKTHEHVVGDLLKGDYEVLAQCLAEAVENVANDSKLVEMINRQG